LERFKAQGDWTAASGYRAMISLFERAPEIDAVFVCNDSMAQGALHAADSSGRAVPESLALVGFDDIPESAHFIPPLTTVRQDLLNLGCEAVSQLYKQLEARRNEEPIPPTVNIIEPELIIRRSSIKVSS
jgi:DNA-binding LacI/PurR family transcriptional regulator